MVYEFVKGFATSDYLKGHVKLFLATKYITDSIKMFFDIKLMWGLLKWIAYLKCD